MSRSPAAFFTWILILALTAPVVSCKWGPDTREPYSLEIQTDRVDSFEDIRWAEHEVVVREIRATPSYLYLKVEEGGKMYWIATGSGNVARGKTYYFNEAVVKRNFISEELDQEFDSIYLVTQLLPEARKNELKRKQFNPHAMSAEDVAEMPSADESGQEQIQQITLNQLLDDPKKFEGQRIEISGVCTKVNAGIMGRNWIHLTSDPDNGPDIVATSDALPGVGETITLQATVSLEKDFGSGYSYPILLEAAILVQ